MYTMYALYIRVYLYVYMLIYLYISRCVCVFVGQFLFDVVSKVLFRLATKTSPCISLLCVSQMFPFVTMRFVAMCVVQTNKHH